MYMTFMTEPVLQSSDDGCHCSDTFLYNTLHLRLMATVQTEAHIFQIPGYNTDNSSTYQH